MATLRQRFGAQVGKFNNFYDRQDQRYTLMFDRAVENRVNLHLTPEGPSVTSMLHEEFGWTTNDGRQFKTLHKAAEHLISIRSQPRGEITGGDATGVQGHPKAVEADYSAVERRAVAQMIQGRGRSFLGGLGDALAATVGAGAALVSSKTGFDAEDMRRYKPLPASRSKGKMRAVRVRHRNPSTYSPRKRSITGLYKGSKMAKRATKRGGNHARSKLPRDPEYVYE